MSEGQQRPRFIVIERHRPGRPPYLVCADPPPGAPRREPLKPRAEFWYRQDAEAFAMLVNVLAVSALAHASGDHTSAAAVRGQRAGVGGHVPRERHVPSASAFLPTALAGGILRRSG